MISLYKIPFLSIVFTLICAGSIAQQLPQINYQGVARKADGSPVSEQPIKLRLTILDGSASGSNVYSETRQVSTNKFGLFTVVIGSSGSVSQNGTLSAVNWATGNKFLQVEIDPQGGNNFTNMGSSQLQAVPYAIYATSASPSGNAGGDLGGTFPNPTVTKLQGFALSNAAPGNGQILKWNGSAWIPSDVVSATGTTISGTSPITSVMQGANASVSISKADAATDGYLSKADWQTFKDKATIPYVDAAILTNSNLITAETTRATAAESLKEDSNNKSIDGTLASNSDLKFPTEKATKTYVDVAISTNATPDASLTIKGKIQLAGDLSGTSALPVIGDGKITTAKILDGSVTDPKIAGGISASKVGLGNVDNTSDLLKPVSTATQTALDSKASVADLALKAPLASPTFTGTVSGITAAMVGLGNSDNTSDVNKPISNATQTALDSKASNTDLVLKAPLASPAFTGTVSGITASMVGLANVDNTTDLLKPVSTATQTALDAKASNTDLGLKAPLASPTFTGTVSGITKSMVGLANVDNTTDLLKPISTATQTALDAKASNTDLASKAPLASPTFTGTVSGITASMVGLTNVDNTTDLLKPVSTATQTALDLKAPLASPTFTGTVSGISKSMVGLANVDNTTDLLKPVSTATQTALDAKASNTDLASKAPLASPTFTGTVSGITKSMVGLANVDNTTDLLKPVSTATQTALDLKAPLASPTFTGTVSGISKSMVGLANVDNTTDLLKPVSTATQTALDLKAPLASPTFTGTVSGISKSMVGLANVDNTTDLLKPVSTATQTALDAKASNTDLALKAPLESPTFTGTVSGITKSMVGLVNVDNTTDLLKPVSTATQTALDLKAPLASPTFTGTVSGISKSMVGLANVDNTTDLLKPISTATQTALDLKATLASPTLTGTPLAPTATAGTNTTQLATTAFVTSAVAAGASSSVFVDLSTNQTVAGTKTFSADLVANGLTIGRGLGAIASNTALGNQALKANTTGFDNSAVGESSLYTNTAGARNTATGKQSLYANNGNDNTATGYLTLQSNTTGSYNSGVGSETLITNTAGGYNTAMGALSLRSNTSGNNNTATGYNSLYANTTGGGNSAIGYNTLPSNTTGTYNTALGTQALEQSNTANQNTAIGVAAIDRNTTGGSNAVLGAFAGRYESDGSTYNTLISNSVLIGAETKPSASGETNQIVIGYQAKGNGSNTVQLGNTSITDVKTSGSVTAAGYKIASGTSSQFLKADGSVDASTYLPLGGGTLTGALNGTSASFTSDISTNGIPIGRGAGSNVANLVIGAGAFGGNTSGVSNIIIGRQAAASSTSASYNTIVGDGAVYYNDVNQAITAFGWHALHAEKGAGNTAIGYETGARGAIASSLTNSTFLGRSASAGAGTIDNATAIGYGASVTASNTIQLGNTSITDVKTSGTITAGGISNTPVIAKTFEASGITLSSSYSGSIIYTQNAALPAFPEDLPDGFNCVIVNYSNFNFTTNTLASTKFYTVTTGNTGTATFSIPTGGTVHINVVTIEGVKRYYVNGNLL